MCNQVPIAHIGYIHYTHYTFEVDFYNLETFHQKYQVKEVLFYVSVKKNCLHTNVSITPKNVMYYFVFSTNPTTQVTLKWKYGSD